MKIVKAYNSVSLIVRIICGLVIGAILGLAFDNLPVVPLLGSIFVGALKAVAPVLVFVLVISAFRSVFEYGYKLQKESDETL